MRFSSTALIAPALCAVSASARFLMYSDEWHPSRPTNAQDRAGIDHVILAFAYANNTAGYQPKMPISTIRSEFPNAKIMVAVGGWGDAPSGFTEATRTDAGITKIANDINTMITNNGLDGVDIDWEYPGGNGIDYKQVPNSQKTYEIAAFPKLLAAIRTAVGKDKLISIAVPGKKIDMIAYTPDNGPKIWPSVDYVNIMSYDLMNRRDNVTNHHTSVKGASEAIDNYLAIGAPAEKINLGFAYYAKYFTTQGDCGSQVLGCPIKLAEDPITGKDTLTSGAYTFEKGHMQPVDASSVQTSYDGTCGPEKNAKCGTGCCSSAGYCGTSPEHCSGGCQHAFGTGCTDPDTAGSWQLAMKNGKTDEDAGGQYYFDNTNDLFWTWDTPELITRKFQDIVAAKGLGGVFAWSLGEDSFDWSHIKQMGLDIAQYAQSGGSKAGASKTDTTQTGMTKTDTTKTDDDSQDYDVVWVDGSNGNQEEDDDADASADSTDSSAWSESTEDADADTTDTTDTTDATWARPAPKMKAVQAAQAAQAAPKKASQYATSDSYDDYYGDYGYDSSADGGYDRSYWYKRN